MLIIAVIVAVIKYNFSFSIDLKTTNDQKSVFMEIVRTILSELIIKSWNKVSITSLKVTGASPNGRVEGLKWYKMV